MRVMILGGTNFVGPLAVRRLAEAGHEVGIAHSGAHEHPDVAAVEHLHGRRDELLAQEGPVERWRPDVLVDTLAGGASAEKGAQIARIAGALELERVVVVSSIDVYQACVEAGFSDRSGAEALPTQALPLTEEAPLRSAPYPGGSPAHDNAAMERAVHGVERVTALRPGAIYGPHPSVREWAIVEQIARRDPVLRLPDGGGQMLHRVAVDRVARAIVAALEHPPEGFWSCNVVDPYDWTYAGLAREIGSLLGWEWTVEQVEFSETDHPWQTSHPIVCSDRRLREVLKVTEPDSAAALAETVSWLWETRDDSGLQR